MNKHKKLMKRADMYKEPMKFIDNYTYMSDMLADMQLEHWKAFDAVSKEDGLKIGDFIDVAVRVAANQVAEKLNEIGKLETLDEMKEKIQQICAEIYTEIAENTNE